MALQLKKLNEVTKDALAAFMADWAEENIIPSSLQKYAGGYDALAEYLDTMEKDPPRLMSPSTLWFLTEGDEILGAVEVRHFLNSGLLKYGGHVGYGVAPKHRGHGYAQQMVKMAMPDVKELGIDSLLICCLESNIPSAKTIENCGGVLENRVEVIRDGKAVTGLRYWVAVD